MINIVPVQVFPKLAEFISFADIQLIPYDKASAQWMLFDANGAQLACGRVEMTHEQYLVWGTEDSYAENCFLENLGLLRM